MFSKAPDNSNRFRLKAHPHRMYHLYLCNYKAHQAKKHLNKLIKDFETRIPSECLVELAAIRDQLKVLFEMEPPLEVVQ